MLIKKAFPCTRQCSPADKRWLRSYTRGHLHAVWGLQTPWRHGVIRSQRIFTAAFVMLSSEKQRQNLKGTINDCMRRLRVFSLPEPASTRRSVLEPAWVVRVSADPAV
ncbi:uncharacterized protein BO72DRAFT_501522 [Aspergillus fijiensis CBS 313.89]|uniref:Uncharacterized protein n=1 Tax=Aspergillus fijiensis CBS 313.89 TaxID=1448319 RepID=A0A8G1VU96_9EURO|nr:uncharacterized protein BO72DRAFT_501522 [Aspergillus fijiensis CBS 313.89]RAK71896.1 hypothetical protein BO72DRAFT_501522 [Aspergillus fijiensis CBS 313.89]